MVIANELLGVGKLDDDTRRTAHKGLRHLRRMEDEEDAEEDILVEVSDGGSNHVDGARTITLLRKTLKEEIWVYEFKIWKMVYKNSTKAENLQNDFDELAHHNPGDGLEWW